MAVTLDGIEVPLPKNWAETQLKQAFEESVVGKLSNSTPIPLGESVIPVYEGGFEVGYTAEGAPKPVSEVGFSHRVLSPWKFAGRSEEYTSELQSRGHLVCRLLL